MILNPVLKNILVDKWGVDVLSGDGGAVKLLVSPRHLFSTQEDAVAASLKAGINQFLEPVPEARQALKDGKANEVEIDALLRRKFRIVIRLGLLDPPDMVPYTKIKDSPEPWDTAEHKDVSKKMALESVVLLKNANGFLPLKKESLKSIAVIGPLADTVRWDWYGGIPRHAVTPLEGIKNEVGANVKINYAADESDHAAVTAASTSDVAVVVVGNDPTCGPDMAKDWHNTADGGSTLPCTVPSDGREGRDRDSITLGQQEQLIKQVYAVNPKTVVLLISSFPFAINWTEANIPAIVHMAHSSQDEGTALAKVLFGDYNPGGHLVTTWPKSVDQLPPMMDYNIRHGRTYMYFKGDPLYPFGYGLSYTTFGYSNLKTSSPHLAKDGNITVSVDVKNTGNRAGDAVVQLYVTHLKSRVERPRKQLAGFKRVTLEPNESKTVQIPLKASTLAFWDQKHGKLEVEAEPVKIMIGDSSANVAVATTARIQ
ncbi:MAG: glycoside hydrolase family 3 C-terminal domain-containing protein [Edaphobacter sp.]